MSQTSPISDVNAVLFLSHEDLHKIRTPLNHIIGFSELLSERAQEEGQLSYVGDLHKVLFAGRQLLALLNPEAPEESNSSSQAAPNGISVLANRDPGSAGALVLVVDDDEMNRDVLSHRLEQQGHTVVMAQNGVEAMAVVRAHSPDLVLLDVMMPLMDGYQVLEEMKKDKSLHDLPVIMISADDNIESVVRCIELGAEDYLMKPFDAPLLKARINASLEKKRAHDREMSLHAQLQAQVKHLQELERLRDDLTHMIIHDLRTPLASLIAGVQTIRVLGRLSEDQLGITEIALSSGETLIAMINGLLDIDKLESGSMELKYALLDPSELVVSAITQVTQLAVAGEIILTRKLDSDASSFEGDEDILRRTLVNLLGNAIKFTPAGGTVTVSVRLSPDKQSLWFSVSDTGEGIPEEAFERIFDKFGQVASGRNTKGTSTGLGLTFCKLAVEAHGGNIAVANAPEHGSILSFDIPLRPPIHA